MRAAAGTTTDLRAQLNLRFKSPKISRHGINYSLFFREKDPKSYAALKPVVDEYKARGIQAEASPSEVTSGLNRVLNAAEGLPLFLFLDPCGLGIPFSDLTGMLSGPRRDTWPPTEVLLNFSLEAVRRPAHSHRHARRRFEVINLTDVPGEKPDDGLPGFRWLGQIDPSAGAMKTRFAGRNSTVQEAIFVPPAWVFSARRSTRRGTTSASQPAAARTGRSPLRAQRSAPSSSPPAKTSR